VHPRARNAATRVAATVAALLALPAVLALASCAGDDWSSPHAAPTPVGVLAAGFVEPGSTPAPESTITPAPGSWSGVHPPRGYRVALLTAGSTAPTRALVDAVRSWARDEHVDLRTIDASDDLLGGIGKALALQPDLVLSAGDDLVDPLATVTANHLDQQFLVVGAELAEPTSNVTAADWAGASFRGEGLGTSSTYDASSFTAARCGDAVRAGVAAVLTGHTGIVVWLG
jgi:hypothetical protein